MATAFQESKAPGSARDALAGIKVIDVDTHLANPMTYGHRGRRQSGKERVPQVKEKDGKRNWVIEGSTVMGPRLGRQRGAGRWRKGPGNRVLRLATEGCPSGLMERQAAPRFHGR